MKLEILPTPSAINKSPPEQICLTSRKVPLVLITAAILATYLFTTLATIPHRFPSFSQNPFFQNNTTLPHSWIITRKNATKSPVSWIQHLRDTSPHGTVTTERVGCREYTFGAQSCVYEGLICIDTTQKREFGRPRVYFVDDTRSNEDDDQPFDDWCGLRHQSADPRYFSTRHWPVPTDRFAPLQSCLDGEFRSLDSLLSIPRKKRVRNATEDDISRARIKWYDSLWFVDLDYVDNNHNNHLLMDIIWMLDVSLWQKSVDTRQPPDEPAELGGAERPAQLFAHRPRHVYLPQGEQDFVQQTSRDMNRLLYSLILQLELPRLYPNLTTKELLQEPRGKERRGTAKMLDAYPELIEENRLVFHREMWNDNNTDLVCTRQLTSGAKLGNGAHERVCRHLRDESYKLYGIEEPETQRIGQIVYPQPPKRIVILNRHVSRKFENLKELEGALRKEFEQGQGVEVEVVSTESTGTAEENVRAFSRAGVLITPHGSQSMGQIWMPRHSALIEVMPVGYNDYSFSLLADSCMISFYELTSRVRPARGKAFYDKECGDKTGQVFDPCSPVKGEDVVVDIDEALYTVRFALERLGYPMRPWFKYARKNPRS